ncbi:MAG TPA: FG-GAP-like repeat-containing protein [Burkholderiaceae bacterium]|nr:FG-GAP-like repeat-containing protein [Burkholderiaceae bacterium]
MKMLRREARMPGTVAIQTVLASRCKVLMRRIALTITVVASLLFSAEGAQAQVAVTDSGTATYSHAIDVPPGVAGMSPKLGLIYSAGGVNGPVGYGWSVQGISSITRCPAIRAVDGRVGGVTYTASDKLCLDGQRLIQTDENGSPTATSNAAGVLVSGQPDDAKGLASGAYREFRTEKDMYARIRAYGYANGDSSGASGPAYFRVWTKAGQVYEYGAGPASDGNTKALISPYGKTVASVWAVARITDTLGNSIDFKYEQRDLAWGSGPTAGDPTYGHEWNIAEIQYSGNKVVFNYADRAMSTGSPATVPHDRAEAYHMGGKNVSVRLLQSITTYVNEAGNMGALGAGTGMPVKTTRLAYENGPVTGRSRLKSIQTCAGGPNSLRCLPPAGFTYRNGGDDSYTDSGAFSLKDLTLSSATGNYGILLGDFNGDGKTDLIRWADIPAENQLYLSNGDGSFTRVSNGTGAGQFNITDHNLFKSDRCYYSTIADINGDGLTDILRYSAVKDVKFNPCNFSDRQPDAGQVVIYLNNGDGSFNKVMLSGPMLLRKDGDFIPCEKDLGCDPMPDPYPQWWQLRASGHQ